MIRAVSAGLLLLIAVAVVPSGVADNQDEIAYVSGLGGWEEGCYGDATLERMIALLKGIGSDAGAGGFPADFHCVVVPPGASSIAVSAADATGSPIRIIVSQHDEEGYLTGTTLCNEGTVGLLPDTLDVALTLVPYSTTTTPCPGAVPPTTGTLFVSWA